MSLGMVEAKTGETTEEIASIEGVAAADTNQEVAMVTEAEVCKEITTEVVVVATKTKATPGATEAVLEVEEVIEVITEAEAVIKVVETNTTMVVLPQTGLEAAMTLEEAEEVDMVANPILSDQKPQVLQVAMHQWLRRKTILKGLFATSPTCASK